MKMTVGKDDTSFHLTFQSLPLDDKLIEEYNCSYNEGASVSIGKLYISQQHVSYAPKIGSTQIIIPIKDISAISKKNTVYLFPNAIEIVTFKDQRYFFSSFLSRDLAFSTLTTIVSAGGGTRTKIFEDAMSAEEKAIKFSNDEITEPESPFQETPTYSTFVPGKKTGDANASSKDLTQVGAGQQLAESGIDKEKLMSRQTPSPSNTMFKSNSSSNVPVTQATATTNTGDNDNSSDHSSNSETGAETRKLSDSTIVDNYLESNSNSASSSINNSVELNKDQNTAAANGNNNTSKPTENVNEQTPQIETTSQPSQNIIKPIPINNQPNSLTGSNNNNIAPSSPLKSSQTINSPPTTSPPQKHAAISKQQSFTKLGNLNINTENPIANSVATPSTQTPATISQQAVSQQPLSQPQSQPAQQAHPINVPIQGSPSQDHLPKFSWYENLPVNDKCDHYHLAEFDEAPWSSEKYPISVREFYELIIRSDFWGSVNTTHSYTEQSISEWKQNTNCCISRNMDFRTAISFKIGPKSTRVTQVQKCKLKSKSELVLQTSSVSKDVPYGDTFSVENLIQVVAADDNSCVTKVSSKIKFTKTTWGVSSMIQKSAAQGNKEFFVLWNTMVRNQIETYVYNKMKSTKMAMKPASHTTPSGPNHSPTPSHANAVHQNTPQVSQETDSRPGTPVSSTSASPSTVSAVTHVSSSVSSGKEKEETGLRLEPGQSVSSAIWSKMNSTEKKFLFVVIALFFFTMLGFMAMIISNSSTTNSINHQIYRFSDTLVLLDSKITQLANGSPAPDASVTYHSDIGKDRLQYLQDRLEMANSLLLRATSLVSSLKGELALENLKLESSQQLQSLQVSSSIFGLSFTSFIFTFLTAIISIIWYNGYFKTIKEYLPF